MTTTATVTEVSSEAGENAAGDPGSGSDGGEADSDGAEAGSDGAEAGSDGAEAGSEGENSSDADSQEQGDSENA